MSLWGKPQRIKYWKNSLLILEGPSSPSVVDGGDGGLRLNDRVTESHRWTKVSHLRPKKKKNIKTEKNKNKKFKGLFLNKKEIFFKKKIFFMVHVKKGQKLNETKKFKVVYEQGESGRGPQS